MMNIPQNSAVTYTGNLGRKPIYKGPHGHHARPVCYGSIAVDMDDVPHDDQSGRHAGARWVTVEAYDELASVLSGLEPGMTVTVRGWHTWPQIYPGRNGSTCIDERMIATSIEPMSSPRAASPVPHPVSAAPAVRATSAALALDATENDAMLAIEQVIAAVITALPTLRLVLTRLIAPHE
jgi:hypothetical protein